MQVAETEAEDIADGFLDAFRQWDVPLLYPHNLDRQIHETERDDICMTVSADAGRLFLSKWLDKEKRGTFPFLKLAPELRNTIYEMVFSFPKEGIILSGGPEYMCVTRRVEQPINHELFGLYVSAFYGAVAGSDDRESYSPDRRLQNLDFWLVNKQIHEESMPVFFQLNRFCVRRAAHLQDLCIGLSFRWEYDGFDTAMKKLASITKLSRLEVYVGHDNWLAMTERHRLKFGRRTRFKQYGQIRGFAELAQACWKAETVVFTGPGHDAIKGWVEERVQELDDEAAGAGHGETKHAAKSGGRKRKAVESGGGKGITTTKKS